MRNYAILRLLLAGFLLYFAWPLIPGAETQLEAIFWGSWLVFLLLTIGSNFATLLQMTSPPAMEQRKMKQRQNA
ncbi:hypothetical protein [Virgibacillus ihumii]|uniref:hypothetical protein n=1 Tax=Virgibacillus ihumii TaxID=2686091 RepID=UPI00157C6529|nr:hypothetical protein [Virgibacillus ihumii]